jgi:ABC-2 type transport system ATP-binding protein
MAIVVSSHLLSEMELMCDRIGIIQHGELIDIQSIRDFIQDGTSSYQFCVTPIERAKELLDASDLSVDMGVDTLQVVLEKEKVPEIVQLLAENNIAIFEVKEVTKTLEDKFLEKTSQKRGV